LDKQLVKKAKKGNKKAFDMLIREISIEGYRLAYYFLENQADSQDALALAIEKAYKNIKKLDKIDKFKQWFMSIVANEAKMIIRKNNQVKIVPIESIISVEQDNKNNTEELLDLQQSLEKMEEESRTILMMKYYEGYTFKEIGEIIGLPESTVKTKTYSLLNKLKKEFERKEKKYV